MATLLTVGGGYAHCFRGWTRGKTTFCRGLFFICLSPVVSMGRPLVEYDLLGKAPILIASLFWLLGG